MVRKVDLVSLLARDSVPVISNYIRLMDEPKEVEQEKIQASTRAGSAVQPASNTSAGSRVTTSAKWQVQFPSGWQDIPPEISCKIEAARLGGEHVAVFEQCRSKKTNWWDTYQIDFGTMIQINLRSGRMRRAQRIVVVDDEESTLALEDLPLEWRWYE